MTEGRPIRPIAMRRKYGPLYVHVLANGSVGLSPVIEGETAPRPGEPVHTFSKEEWESVVGWTVGAKKKPDPQVFPFQPAPWWLRLLGIGGTIPKAQVPKGYRK